MLLKGCYSLLNFQDSGSAGAFARNSSRRLEALCAYYRVSARRRVATSSTETIKLNNLCITHYDELKSI
jgi:hypothetical protein